MSSFPAAYAGRCGNCDETFSPGEMVEYEGDGTLVVQDCCGTPDAPRPVRTGSCRAARRPLTAAAPASRFRPPTASAGACDGRRSR